MMKKVFLSLLIFSLISGCSTIETLPSRENPDFNIIGVSTDPEYGVTKEKPIKVGGFHEFGIDNEVTYFKLLRGPEGQYLMYHRQGLCCEFDTPNGANGEKGVLDMWTVKYKGGKEVTLFINIFDYEDPMAPVGFTYHRRGQEVAKR